MTENTEDSDPTQLPEHHKKDDYCLTRKLYRRGRKKTAVKVFTINSESKYIIVSNVNATGLAKDLVKLCSKYGAVENYQELKSYPVEKFTQIFLICFQNIQSARIAKRRLDEMYFYGSMLHVFYAPEYETVEQTREKLNERRRSVVTRIKTLKKEDQRSKLKGFSSKVDSTKVRSDREENDFQTPCTIGNFSNITKTFVETKIVPNVPIALPLKPPFQQGNSQNKPEPFSSIISHHTKRGLDRKAPKLVKHEQYIKSNGQCESHYSNVIKSCDGAGCSTSSSAIPGSSLLPRSVLMKMPKERECLLGNLDAKNILPKGDTAKMFYDGVMERNLYFDDEVQRTASKITNRLKRPLEEKDDSFLKCKIMKT